MPQLRSTPPRPDTTPCRVFNRNFRGYPKDSIYIGRGTPWGNPFEIGKHGDRDEVCDLFTRLIEQRMRDDPTYLTELKRQLRGKNLLCSCKPKRCHGDYLHYLVNSP